MKNILIFGHSRAGKTSLAKRISDEFSLNVFNEDHVITAFEKAFPQLDINGGENYAQTADNVTPFIVYYLYGLSEHSGHKTGSKFVADLTFFNFDIGIPLMKCLLAKTNRTMSSAFVFINLENNKSSEELYDDIKAYDTPEDWTYYLSDHDLRKHCDENVGSDPDFYEKWRELNFLRYDVAQGREQVFDKIIEDLKSAE